jgi:hypothetical protein
MQTETLQVGKEGWRDRRGHVSVFAYAFYSQIRRNRGWEDLAVLQMRDSKIRDSNHDAVSPVDGAVNPLQCSLSILQ